MIILAQIRARIISIGVDLTNECKEKQHHCYVYCDMSKVDIVSYKPKAIVFYIYKSYSSHFQAIFFDDTWSSLQIYSAGASNGT